MDKWQAISIVLAGIFHAFLAIEANSAYGSSPRVYRTFPELEASVAAANSDLAVKLYFLLRGQSANIFFSPHTIAAVLGVVLSGARSSTEGELIKAMGLQKLASSNEHEKEIHLGMRFLVSSQCCRRNATLATFNRVFVDRRVAVENSFAHTFQSQYGGIFMGADIKNKSRALVKYINSGVENFTKGKISEFLSDNDISPGTSMGLLNAIYFQSKWVSPFSPTRKRIFRTVRGENVEVPMMHQFSRVSYTVIQELGAYGFWLPFADNTLGMVFLSPKDPKEFSKMESLLYVSRRRIQKFIKKIRTSRQRKLDLFIPKFKIDSKVDLKERLHALGIKEAFKPTANFSGISTSHSISVSKMVYEAGIEVNEQWVEAAATTVATPDALRVTVADLGTPRSRRRSLMLGNSFVFLIFDKATNSIIFMGRVGDPTQG